jgi:hypothetical protein
VALAESVRDPSRRVIPVLLPGVKDQSAHSLPPFLRRRLWVDFRGGLEDESALQSLVAGILGEPLYPVPGAAQIGTTRFEPRISSKWTIVVILVALLVAGVLLREQIGALVWPELVRLHDVQIEGKQDVIAAFNVRGRSLWRRKVEAGLQDVLMYDLDKDGNPEAIAATHRDREQPGWILVYDHKGVLLDEYNMWKPSIYGGGQADDMNIVGLDVLDLTSDGTTEIVALAQDTRWYPSRLAILQFREGQIVEVSEYWHPGLLSILKIADLNKDGIYQVVCGGENNDLKLAVSNVDRNVFVVFLLDGTAISGQAPPWFGNAPHGSEVWYAYMEPGTAINAIDFDDWDKDGTLEVHVASGNCSYFLDRTGAKAEFARGTMCTGDPRMRILR